MAPAKAMTLRMMLVVVRIWWYPGAVRLANSVSVRM